MLHWRHLAQRDPRTAVRRLVVLGGLATSAALLAIAPAFADDRPDGAELATASSMLIVMMAFFVAAGLGIVWAWKNGEFSEPEEVKYQMLAQADDEVDYWKDEHPRDEDDEDDGPPPAPPAPKPLRELVGAR